MWRGSICITSCQHKLCQTQLLCWELTQGLRQQHRWKWKQPLEQGFSRLLQYILALSKRCPGCWSALPLTWLREVKEVSLCLLHQLQNSLEIRKAVYLRWSCIPTHAASPSSSWDTPSYYKTTPIPENMGIHSFIHSFTILFQAASFLFLFSDIWSMTRKQRKQSGKLKNSCTAFKYHLRHSCNQI